MLVVARFRLEEGEAPAFVEQARAALAALAARPGYRSGDLGRATDDRTLWALVTRWDGVGDYRRALSAYDVRVEALPLLSAAMDEPSAYEVVIGEGATTPNTEKPRGAEQPHG